LEAGFPRIAKRVDTEAKIAAALTPLATVIGRGLVTLEKVRVLRCGQAAEA